MFFFLQISLCCLYLKGMKLYFKNVYNSDASQIPIVSHPSLLMFDGLFPPCFKKLLKAGFLQEIYLYMYLKIYIYIFIYNLFLGKYILLMLGISKFISAENSSLLFKL